MLIEDAARSESGVLLYADLTDDFTARTQSVFIDAGDHVEHVRYEDPKLARALAALLAARRKHEDWRVVEYYLEDGRVSVTFVYPDMIDPKQTSDQRERDAVRRRFGNKRITHPDDGGADLLAT